MITKYKKTYKIKIILGHLFSLDYKGVGSLTTKIDPMSKLININAFNRRGYHTTIK